MATLAQFKIDSNKVQTGEWVSPGEEYEDLEILTRGFTDQYTDAHQAALRRAARPFGGDVRLLPLGVSRAILVDKMLAHVLLGVRNLADSDGQPVTFERFGELLRDPNYSDLVTAAIKAAARVGTTKAEEVAEAAGN